MKELKQALLIFLSVLLYTCLLCYVVSESTKQKQQEIINKCQEKDMDTQWRLLVRENMNVRLIQERDSLINLLNEKL